MGNGGLVRTSRESDVANKYEVASVPMAQRVEVVIPVKNRKLKSLDIQSIFDPKRREVLSMFIGSQLCMQNTIIKDAFQKYIFECQWAEILLNSDSNNPCFELQRNEATGSVCFNQYCLSLRSNSMDTCDANIGMSKAQIIQQLKVNDSKDSDSFRVRKSIVTSISHKNLNSFVLAGLWPYFLESPQFIKISEDIQAELLAATSTAAKTTHETKNLTICAETMVKINDECNPASESIDVNDDNEEDQRRQYNLASSSASTCPVSPYGTIAPNSPRPFSNSLSASMSAKPPQMMLAAAEGKGIAIPSILKTESSSPTMSRRTSTTSSRKPSCPNYFLTSSTDSGLKSPHSNSIAMAQKSKRIKDLYFQAVDDPTSEESLGHALSSGTWPADLIHTLDHHPRSITIADASVHSRGFPLIYVNRAFEAMSLYSRDEALGRSCGQLLSCDHTESDHIQHLSESLCNGVSCKIALTNKRKDGTEFLNLLATLPVRNVEGELTYIIAVQYDVTSAGACLKEIRQIDDLLRLIANVLM